VTAYYNEIDPYAAQWLRNLIDAGHIAPGVVDTRDIRDVTPGDLHGFTQCHFFAGIGVWSHALRRAGWPDDRPVWTGSCPCQPFSVAGMGGGFDDERHLWPFFHYLIEKRSPPVVFGEQVASKDGLAWLDLVHADMEGAGYAFEAVDFCAAGVGAPHIRQRLWFVGVADADQRTGGQGRADFRGRTGRSDALAGSGSSSSSVSCGLVHANGGDASAEREQPGGEHRQQQGDRCTACGLGDDDDAGLPARERAAILATGRGPEGRAVEQSGGAPCGVAHTEQQRHDGIGAAAAAPGPERGRADAARPAVDAGHEHPGPTNGLWEAADWLLCRDGKWRPVEPGTFPLAHGAAARVGRLRAYGNAINSEAATEVILATREVLG
jgi:DNA (cytosine-5)-methyltransferase 1